MGENEKTAEFQSGTVGQLGLYANVQNWNKDKASAEQQGLEWAALQGKYYGGKKSVKYVTKGSIIACSSGCSLSRIDLLSDHGVEAKGSHLPILTVQDFTKQNISSFGVCKIKQGMSCTQSNSLCTTKITSQWEQDTITTSSGNAALLQADAFTVCSTGGLVTVMEVNKTPQESLMAVLKEQYGFDERTIKIMLNVYEAIQNKYPDEKQIKKDWRFTRLMGGLKYGLKEKEGVADEIQWNQTAGDATYGEQERFSRYGTLVMMEVDLPVKEYMKNELGLSSEDYEYLQYKVRVQNSLAGEDASTMTYKDDGTNPKDEKYKTVFFDNMKTGLGGSLDEAEFISTWNQQCYDMCGMTDFAHQQITTSTILATEVSKNGWFVNIYLGGDRKREQMSGWLGDATIFGGNGELPSFGNDDYMADLDAENIGHMIRNEEYSYINAVRDYYDRRLLEDNRAKVFLENNSLEDVKKLLYDDLIMPDYAYKSASTNVYEERIKIDELYKYENDFNWMKILRDKSPDTYNFFRSLEALLPEIGEFE